MARKKEPKYKKIDLIAKVVEMTTSGIPQPDIIDWLKTEADCKIDYCYQILKDAKPIILDTLKDVAIDRIGETIAKMERMYQEAVKEDKRLALDIQKEINKISGLHQQKVDVTTGGKEINQISVIKLIEVKKEDDNGDND